MPEAPLAAEDLDAGMVGADAHLSGIRKWWFTKGWFSNGSKMHTSNYVCENLAQTLLGLTYLFGDARSALTDSKLDASKREPQIQESHLASTSTRPWKTRSLRVWSTVPDWIFRNLPGRRALERLWRRDSHQRECALSLGKTERRQSTPPFALDPPFRPTVARLPRAFV